MNPYSKLGVSSSATQNEIKAAWKKLAIEFHPDRNSDPDAVKKLQEINEAYEMIKTPEKRVMYDSTHYRHRHSYDSAYDSSDLFSHFFSEFNKRSNSIRRANINVNLTIDEIKTGKSISHNLDVDGTTFTVNAEIPPGCPDGARFNVKQIKASDGSNIIVSVSVSTVQEPNRQRHRDDILLLTAVDAIDAIIGTEIDIEPFAGHKFKLKIPAGTQTDTKLVLRGIGLPIMNSETCGNVIAYIKIATPTDLTDEQLDILRNIR